MTKSLQVLVGDGISEVMGRNVVEQRATSGHSGFEGVESIHAGFDINDWNLGGVDGS